MTITLDGRKLMANVTMKVKITLSKEMRLRVWVARQLFCLSARVLGCKVEMTFNFVRKKYPADKSSMTSVAEDDKSSSA